MKNSSTFDNKEIKMEVIPTQQKTAHDQNIFKDYTDKIGTKFRKGTELNFTEIESVNNLVTFLNWSFNKKNNFFIQDFNKKKVFDICSLYNELKSEILNPMLITNLCDLFAKIEDTKIKTLKFIIKQYILHFDVINNIEQNKVLCEQVTKDSMILLLQIISNKK